MSLNHKTTKFVKHATCVAFKHYGKLNFNDKNVNSITKINCKLQHLLLVLSFSGFLNFEKLNYSLLFKFNVWILVRCY